MKKPSLIFQILMLLVMLFVLDFVFTSPSNGSMVIGILFWTCIGQGMLAIIASADLSGGMWHKVIRPYILEYYPLLTLFPIAFLLFARHIVIYPWSGSPTSWFNPTFFILRNVFILLLPVIFAHFYVESVKKETPNVGKFAVFYLLSFVISQSFMAFDVVMSAVHPWSNTLFGGFFIVESLQAGIVFCALLSIVLSRKNAEVFSITFGNFTLMMMGFALFWAGLFYSQYLVIWYGNLPEEVSFIAKRENVSYLRIMGIFVLIALFFIPFLALISRKVKASMPIVAGISLIVFSGLFAERLVYLIPITEMSIVGVLFPFLILGAPFVALMVKQSGRVIR